MNLEGGGFMQEECGVIAAFKIVVVLVHHKDYINYSTPPAHTKVIDYIEDKHEV
jgi:hypothetical protein